MDLSTIRCEGEKLGLSGPDLVSFVDQQLAREREKAEREREERALERQERAMQREFELKKLELEANRAQNPGENVGQDRGKVPALKLPWFDGKDDLDAYLQRFERVARARGCEEEIWGVQLFVLLILKKIH